MQVWRRGLDLEGSRSVAVSTPVRISVPDRDLRTAPPVLVEGELTMDKTRREQAGQPQEIPDEEHEQLVSRVCAIDVAKTSGKVCTRVPHATSPHRRVCTVWDVTATVNAVSALAEQLLERGIEKVTVEST